LNGVEKLAAVTDTPLQGMVRLMLDKVAGESGCARVASDELMQVVDFPDKVHARFFS
jgi:hypothetical protein